MSRAPSVTCHNFAECSDAEIIAATREVLAKRDRASLRPVHRRLLTTKNPDVMIAGKFLWAHLCGWREAS